MANIRHFKNGKAIAIEREAPSTPAARARSEVTISPEKALASADADALPMLEETIKSSPLVVLSLPNCSYCEELMAKLRALGVPSSVQVKWDKSRAEYQDRKAALSSYAGASFSFPQVFASGEYQGGYEEAVEKLEAGWYDALLLKSYGATPTTVQTWVQERGMLVFSLPNCPQCEELKEALAHRGLPVDSIFMKWNKQEARYASLKAQLQSLAQLEGFTFPQTFLKQKYEGSFEEVMEKLTSGAYDADFQELFGIAPPAAAAPAEAAPAAAAASMDFDDDF
mmetsp:Transcript_60804/g.144885  ORF Transcript_60804/g.144885 Transcript_60804/m.144885 type:complete len:282 (-) Transcript_60804:141-986(-)|eukprot:CAMPEP_0178418864 /NCGR_PEP_ID=MMETSP0689_2-20121128/25309_1 /TAXON_ID=160604 /ORGANISM="Amphidinium massartii, Strain CS-259" /LENGTH=281 /DNA_ID=CAMNT_0020040273 /DNA_START=38 /DNA_END=883 /DNA_ORIENTATION=+